MTSCVVTALSLRTRGVLPCNSQSGPPTKGKGGERCVDSAHLWGTPSELCMPATAGGGGLRWNPLGWVGLLSPHMLLLVLPSRSTPHSRQPQERQESEFSLSFPCVRFIPGTDVKKQPEWYHFTCSDLTKLGWRSLGSGVLPNLSSRQPPDNSFICQFFPLVASFLICHSNSSQTLPGPQAACRCLLLIIAYFLWGKWGPCCQGN